MKYRVTINVVQEIEAGHPLDAIDAVVAGLDDLNTTVELYEKDEWHEV
jgi:hypothetical protein